MLAKKATDKEEEVIEIVLEAGQCFSVDALIKLIEKNDMGFINEKKQPLTKDQPQPILQFLNQETDQGLSSTNDLFSKSFIMPIKKKRMHLLMGNITKPSDKKKRS